MKMTRNIGINVGAMHVANATSLRQSRTIGIRTIIYRFFCTTERNCLLDTKYLQRRVLKSFSKLPSRSAASSISSFSRLHEPRNSFIPSFLSIISCHCARCKRHRGKSRQHSMCFLRVSNQLRSRHLSQFQPLQSSNNTFKPVREDFVLVRLYSTL